MVLVLELDMVSSLNDLMTIAGGGGGGGSGNLNGNAGDDSGEEGSDRV